jgi:hypothetical protein
MNIALIALRDAHETTPQLYYPEFYSGHGVSGILVNLSRRGVWVSLLTTAYEVG